MSTVIREIEVGNPGSMYQRPKGSSTDLQFYFSAIANRFLDCAVNHPMINPSPSRTLLIMDGSYERYRAQTVLRQEEVSDCGACHVRIFGLCRCNFAWEARSRDLVTFSDEPMYCRCEPRTMRIWMECRYRSLRFVLSRFLEKTNPNASRQTPFWLTSSSVDHSGDKIS